MIKAFVSSETYRDPAPGGEPVLGREFVVWIEGADLDRMLAAYDPNSSTSPGVADARPVLRAILDAAIAAEEV